MANALVKQTLTLISSASKYMWFSMLVLLIQQIISLISITGEVIIVFTYHPEHSNHFEYILYRVWSILPLRQKASSPRGLLGGNARDVFQKSQTSKLQLKPHYGQMLWKELTIHSVQI